MELRGIILYDIQLNGDLNGVYTNNLTPNAELFTETAHFLRDESFGDFINGLMLYEAFYFDFESGRVNAILEFRIVNGLITARWWREGEDRIEDNLLFTGEGYRMNHHQIVIAYTN
ncbi:hypothetical protein FCR2A7T_24560 [Flavobacterium cauense R2A-7]|uniref:Uncharacterized protein n=1 Tax=Flavobacterium cauense R2A-7 TaxID=1341154 RepID=V6RYD2_9FLAO|nr:hypothetical protein [Flavobacterium cauense]ESU19042.1 hypothetical protein FCR2A7T_24560 [Flavobacterium cauense R2A-7]KGO82328.1 hypothetical protein Q762_06535 [Flavobacterium cauense R2A-7]TWI15294.1 hypothetical protein IP98_00286 [Flavobacterium cauense R2A-7]